MRDKVLDAARKYWFIVAVLVAALVKQILVTGLSIYAIPAAACDDQLLKNWAFSMAGLDWKGAFNEYTFAKEPGFSFFMAVCFRLHLPYIFTVTLGYSVASIIFATSLNKVFSHRIFVFLTYLAVLFNPVSFALSTLQRVYRNGFAMVLTLLVFGGLIHMYFSVLEEKQWKMIAWTLLTGLSLGYLWVTKSDTVWILPFALAVCGVMFVMLLVKHRNLKSLPRYFCLVFPFLSVFLFSSVVKFCDTRWYGYSSVEYYDEVMDDLTHVKSDHPDERISLSREQLRNVCKVSPTLAGVQKSLEKYMQKYGEFDTHPEDGEVEDGWLGWAMLECFSKADIYESCEKANTFYKNVYEELEAAFADGRLERVPETATQKYYIDTAEHRGELADNVWRIVRYMASFHDANARVKSNGGEDEIGFRQFEELTRNKVAFNRLKYDFLVEGWIVFPEYHREKMHVFIEDEQGNQYAEVKFRSSPDVYQHLEDTEYREAGIARCRFKTGWDNKEDRDVSKWYLAVYEEGKDTLRIAMERSGFVIGEDVFATGSLDSYIVQAEGDAVVARCERTVARLNIISAVYRFLGPCMFWLGAVCYVVLTVVTVLDLRKKKFEYKDAWLIATGFGLSILVFALGISVVDLTQCPAVNEMYLSSGYAILLGAESICIWKCVEYLISVAGRKKEAVQ